VEFTKYHGLGNDFVFVEDFEGALVAEAPSLAEVICDRHFGVGADGLVLITKPGPYFTMRVFNVDGSEAEMCGNAIRCIAMHLLDRNLEQGETLTIGTLHSQKEIRVQGNGQFSVNMGTPLWTPSQIPVQVGLDEALNIPIDVNGKTFLVSGVSMGNPHGVILVPDLADVLLETWGPLIETNPLFPAKANIEFVEVINESHIRVLVWERGVGPTLACGTGACASAVVCSKLGKTGREVTVSLPGGDLEIKWAQSDHVWMTGPATRVFSGRLE